MSPIGAEHQLLDVALKDCGEELDLVMKSLQQVSLSHPEQNPNIFSAEETDKNNPSSSDSSNSTLCTEWADLFLKEMTNAGSLEDARVRASRVLQAFEKEKTEVLTRENLILKRAVVIQHQLLKERHMEMEDLKKNLLQYQAELRILDVKNYALSMHLRQGRTGDAVSGCFRGSDVF